MTPTDDERLANDFTAWVAQLSHERAVQKCAALPLGDQLMLDGRAIGEAYLALADDDGNDAAYLEEIARRLDVLADADSSDPAFERAKELRDTAAALRNPEEWRAQNRAEAAAYQISEARLESLALTQSCWAQIPVEARLRRIEEVLPRIRELADRARAEGHEDEEPAFGEDIGSLWKLRESLRHSGNG
jgi:hypothetical protein